MSYDSVLPSYSSASSLSASLARVLSQETCTGNNTLIEGRVGSIARSGQVTICDGTELRAVCDENWDMNDAKVVCRELGFPPEGMCYVCVCLCIHVSLIH